VRDAIEVYIAVLEAAEEVPGHPRERALRALEGAVLRPQRIGGHP